MKASSKKKEALPKNTSDKNFWYYSGGIVLFTLVILFSVTDGRFLSWDDFDFVTTNKSITSLSWHSITDMFSSTVMGNYSPLANLSYALDYSLAHGLNPKTFHTTSLFFHLINTFLVFLFIYKLSNKQLITAAICSILFGIHPMHVESVAWISERRDVLYTMFYLGGLIFYLQYLEKFSSVKLLIAFLFFTCSVLSKGQAVTFPVILLVLDFLLKRKFDWKAILEKIPFFAVAIISAYIALKAQRESIHLTDSLSLSVFDNFLAGSYGLLLYLVKLFIPFQLSGYHPYPFTGSSIPVFIYLAPVIVLGILGWVFFKYKHNRVIIGSLLFFLISILPVLKFLPVGQTIIAERYTYIPYIGLFYLIAHLYNGNSEKTGQRIKLTGLTYALIIYIVTMAAITWSRKQVWKDSIVFWGDVIKKYPENNAGYYNRGYAYYLDKQLDAALNDFNKGIEVDSTFYLLYLNRGTVYNELKQSQNAIYDFNKGIKLRPEYTDLYMNRAIAYTGESKFDKAIEDYSTVINLDSTKFQAYMNRGSLYTDALGDFDKGINDFQRMLRLDPGNKDALTNIGVAYFRRKNFDEAIAQYNLILEKNQSDGKIFYLRAVAFASKNDFASALNDGNKAKELGFAIDENMLLQWKNAISIIK